MGRWFESSFVRRYVALSLAVFLLLNVASRQATGTQADHSLENGHFYSQTGRGDGSGFGVRDDGADGAGNLQRFWTEFQRFGAVDGLGYPLSRRFVGAGGYTYQVFQRGVLQWRPERNGAVLANTFDWLHDAGRDGFLERLGVPAPVADDGSNGEWLQARSARLGWLTEPKIKAKLLSTPDGAGNWSLDDAIQFYGLPMSRPEKRGPFVIQRFQRIAFQLWVESVPGMPQVGSVVAVLGGDMLKQAGVVAAEQTVPEASTYTPVAAEVRGIYLSYVAAGRDNYRQYLFDLVANTEINAVVVDVKGDLGYITYPSQLPVAREIGAAARPTTNDFGAFIADLHRRGVYVIGRVVTFKDDPLAKARPALAVIDARSGGLWRDSGGSAWVDPFRQEVWDYEISVALEAARHGVDEIQFDYIRFPLSSGSGTAQFAKDGTKQERIAAIAGFLGRARAALQPLGVKVSADIFGGTAWADSEPIIGQKLEDMARNLDVVSPMLYPSNFTMGIPGYPLAVQYPYEVVNQSARRTIERLKGLPVVVRPWLQDFPDYAFDRRPFTVKEVTAQIRGARDGGARGWLLWNSSVRYTREALAAK